MRALMIELRKEKRTGGIPVLLAVGILGAAYAFASLSAQMQSILILRFVLDLGDAEIGSLVGMSHSAVQRHRKKTLDELRNKLTALMPKGG